MDYSVRATTSLDQLCTVLVRTVHLYACVANAIKLVLLHDWLLTPAYVVEPCTRRKPPRVSGPMRSIQKGEQYQAVGQHVDSMSTAVGEGH